MAPLLLVCDHCSCKDTLPAQVPPLSDASLSAARANFSMWITQQPDGQVAWSMEVTGSLGSAFPRHRCQLAGCMLQLSLAAAGAAGQLCRLPRL